KKQNISPLAEASTKFNLEATRLQIDLPMLEVILQTKAEVEALSAQAGLRIIHHFLEQEIDQCCGVHGRQSAYRHGAQPGYVVFAGRKVPITKPRVRAKGTAELQKLVQRPVAADLVALLIDGQYFRKECLIVALGVDKQGQKHVLGLWQGATENSTLVRELLADLRERGLNTEAAILVVVDGAKALYKGVRDVFGERALIQRCRVHKLRNVLEHLPLEK